MKTLGQITKEYRKKQKLSLRAFAKEADISFNYLSALERGVHPKTGKDIMPSFETIQKISSAMGRDLIELMHELGIPCDRETAVECGAIPPPSLSGRAPIEPFRHIPLTQQSLEDALREHRILVTPFPVPRKGSLMYVPNIEYDMPVMYEVTDVDGGVYIARAEIGTVQFTLFDIGKIIFSSRKDAHNRLEELRREQVAAVTEKSARQ